MASRDIGGKTLIPVLHARSSPSASEIRKPKASIRPAPSSSEFGKFSPMGLEFESSFKQFYFSLVGGARLAERHNSESEWLYLSVVFFCSDTFLRPATYGV